MTIVAGLCVLVNAFRACGVNGFTLQEVVQADKPIIVTGEAIQTVVYRRVGHFYNAQFRNSV